MTLRVDDRLGDARGSHITLHRYRAGPYGDEYVAVYRTKEYGMCFPCGYGGTKQEATRDLWRRLHGGEL